MKLHKSKDIVVQVEKGGCVLLNMKNGNFYGLHDLSFDIWNMLNETYDYDEIISNISKKYKNISKEDIISDIYSFIEELISEEIIEKHE